MKKEDIPFDNAVQKQNSRTIGDPTLSGGCHERNQRFPATQKRALNILFPANSTGNKDN